MADRRVTHTGKDGDGDITRLCYPGQSWSPRSKANAIEPIKQALDLGVYDADIGVVE